MKNRYLVYSIFTGISCLSVISCREQPSSSTTYISHQAPEVKEPSPQETTSKAPELESVAGKHSTGKLYLRYNDNTKEMKKWTILAPYEVTLHDAYIEIKFTGDYYIDGEPTGDGEKKLFIKKEDVRSILVSE